MPKTNARKNTRNRSHAAKRVRTRELRASLQTPAKAAAKPAAKPRPSPLQPRKNNRAQAFARNRRVDVHSPGPPDASLIGNAKGQECVQAFRIGNEHRC